MVSNLDVDELSLIEPYIRDSNPKDPDFIPNLIPYLLHNGIEASVVSKIYLQVHKNFEHQEKMICTVPATQCKYSICLLMTTFIYYIFSVVVEFLSRAISCYKPLFDAKYKPELERIPCLGLWRPGRLREHLCKHVVLKTNLDVTKGNEIIDRLVRALQGCQVRIAPPPSFLTFCFLQQYKLEKSNFEGKLSMKCSAPLIL